MRASSGRLADAVGADEGGALAVADHEVDVAEQLGAAGEAPVDLADANRAHDRATLRIARGVVHVGFAVRRRALVSLAAMVSRPIARVGFFGPFGTFTEQAVRTQDDLVAAELVDFATVPDVLDAVEAADVDCGVVPIENAIEGVVNLTQDALAFDYDLLITREIVLDIEHCLVGLPGLTIDAVKAVVSFPVATAQCHRFLRETLRGIEIRTAQSTASAAKFVAEGDGGAPAEGGLAAIAPRVAAERYGLEVIAEDIADHDGNQTRFVVVSREGVPRRTGNDRTGLVVFQRADAPGSLVSILQEFAARRINLSNLLSRPTKDGGLGDYCFVIYADAHVEDELLADVMRALHLKQGRVKFLGSYPAVGPVHADGGEHHDVRWNAAQQWVASLQSMIERS